MAEREGLWARFRSWRRHRRAEGGPPGALHFQVGIGPQGEQVPEGGDLWSPELGSGFAAEPLQEVLIPSAPDRTEELVHEETTYFADDLEDPRNPRHAEWEARHDAEVAQGKARVEAAESESEPPPA